MKRDLIVAILLTFCLTASIFMVTTSNSAEYDPWVDLNDDGKINIFDVVGMTSRYGATGDSTKNVTIAGDANKMAYSVEGVLVGAGLDFYTPYISVDGYSKMTVCLATYGNSMDCYIFCQHLDGAEWFAVDQISDVYSFSKTYAVPNQELMIRYTNREAFAVPISIDVYLIP
jgi:hypothetical protein